jgi:hypothetical protein
MLRRKPGRSQPVSEPKISDSFPLSEDEMPLKELMTLLTRKTEQRIDAAFGKSTKIQKEHA